jgi:hypothetical protein
MRVQTLPVRASQTGEGLGRYTLPSRFWEAPP